MSTLITATPKVDAPNRCFTGCCVPYDELTFLVPNPNGERVMRGAFNASLRARGDRRLFLFRGHDHREAIGHAVDFSDEPDGLHARFVVRETAEGDRALADLLDGYLPGLSVGFRPVEVVRGCQGEAVVVRGELKEVSLVTVGAYEGARTLAMRAAQAAQGIPTNGTILVNRRPVAQPFIPARPVVPGPVTRHAPAHLRHLLG